MVDPTCRFSIEVFNGDEVGNIYKTKVFFDMKYGHLNGCLVVLLFQTCIICHRSYGCFLKLEVQ